jgi:mono/diheme cytochrome c family protein
MQTRVVALFLFAAGCGLDAPADTSDTTQALSPQLQHGKDVWFKSTFGGEKFFSVILPGPPFNLPLDIDGAITSPRDTRFTNFGLLNDPDCTQGDATTGFLDRCADPESAGVVGVRKKVVITPTGPKVLVGVACAACHAGLDPANPPADPNHPTWANIHATVGNQFIQIGKLFGGHLSPHDPRKQVFDTWAPGTVDTTAIESDGINNPGIITQFFDLPNRPFFNLTSHGLPINVHRAGQGGEDDAGCEAAALRVYFNIGMCAAECMVPHLANGPGGTQTPIDDAECTAACPQYVEAKAAVTDECAFMASQTSSKLEDAPNGDSYVDHSKLGRGKEVFRRNCASCHSNGAKDADNDVLSDDLIHPMADIGTNSCRARSTNWAAGHIWANFSSDQYKARPTGGPGFYRDVPLQSVWATAPFFHNNRLGSYSGDQTVGGRIAAYEEAMDQLLNPWKRDLLGSIQKTSDSIQVPTPIGPVTLPAGTPVALFANLNPATLQNLCPDLIENQGHYYGWNLSDKDKAALTEYLKTR